MARELVLATLLQAFCHEDFSSPKQLHRSSCFGVYISQSLCTPERLRHPVINLFLLYLFFNHVAHPQMFTVSPTCTNEHLLKYLELYPVKTSKCALEHIPGKKKRKRMYTYKEKEQDHDVKKPKGLTKFLRKTFYKHYKTTKSRFGKSVHRVKMASSKAIGKRVDKVNSSKRIPSMVLFQLFQVTFTRYVDCFRNTNTGNIHQNLWQETPWQASKTRAASTDDCDFPLLDSPGFNARCRTSPRANARVERNDPGRRHCGRSTGTAVDARD
jgi:hypothetical protein